MEVEEPKRDLLLAKRRILVITPFLICLLIYLVIILFICRQTSRDFFTINYAYAINFDNYTKQDNADSFCKEFPNDKNYYNFTSLFNIKNEILSKFEAYSDEGIGYCFYPISITVLFLLICFVFMYIYVRKSDEKIREDPIYEHNNSHPITTVFYLIRTILLAIQHILFAISSYNFSNYNEKEIFPKVFDYMEKCITDKKKFKKDFYNCWQIRDLINTFNAFVFLLFVFDLLSLILTILAKKYNIWSWLLSKITFGKFKYNEIEENKGSIVPQKSDNENNKEENTQGLLSPENQ